MQSCSKVTELLPTYGQDDPFSLELSDLFTDKEEILAERMAMARHRIIGVFHNATIPDLRARPFKSQQRGGRRRRYNSGRRVDGNRVRSSDNAIFGCSERLMSLVGHVSDQIGLKHPMLTYKDLPVEVLLQLRGMPKNEMPACHLQRMMETGQARLNPRDYVVWQLRIELIKQVLLDLCAAGDIEYYEGLGIWQLRQSVVNEYLRARNIARKVLKPGGGERIKDDKRTYHGRNRGQSHRRGIPEGTSIGMVS